MRLGGQPVGRWGLTVMAVAGAAGLLLAWQGWAGRGPVAPSLAGGAGPSAASPAASTPPASPSSPASAGPASPAPAGSGPLLSSEPFANVAYQVWPGPVSAAAKVALTGLHVSVRRQGSGITVTASVKGQAPAAPHHYAGGARVYVVEAATGDDSGGSDYNLGDDGLVVTDAQGRIIR